MTVPGTEGATTTTTPAAGGTPPPATNASAGGTPPPASSGEWYASLPDESKGWVQNKQYRDLPTAIEAHRNLEKLVGVPANRVLKLPENLEDPTAMGEVFGRLGRPDKPEGYNIKAPEGGSKELSEWAGKTFHELGLTKKQGETLFNKWNEQTSAQQAASLEASKLKLEQDTQALQKKWGAAYDQNSLIAAKGARKFGIDEATMDKIELAIGYQGVMELFHKFGAATGEDAFVNGGSGQGIGAVTPEAAKSRIAQLTSDSEWSKRYLAGGGAEKAEMERLHQMAAFGA